MPVDMFPAIDIPVVVVATFYSGMPPEQVENSITFRLERFLTLGTAASTHRVALAHRRQHHQSLLPSGDESRCGGRHGRRPRDHAEMTPPASRHSAPVVLKFDASSLPVCLLTLGGEGLSKPNSKTSRRMSSAISSPASREPPFRSPSADAVAR